MTDEVPRLFTDDTFRKMLDECIQKDYTMSVLVTSPSKEQRNTFLDEAISRYEIQAWFLKTLNEIERLPSLRAGLAGKRGFLLYKDFDEALNSVFTDLHLVHRFYSRLRLIRPYCVAFFATAPSMENIRTPINRIFNYILEICPTCGDVTTYRMRRFTSCFFDKEAPKKETLK